MKIKNKVINNLVPILLVPILTALSTKIGKWLSGIKSSSNTRPTHRP